MSKHRFELDRMSYRGWPREILQAESFLCPVVRTTERIGIPPAHRGQAGVEVETGC